MLVVGRRSAAADSGAVSQMRAVRFHEYGDERVLRLDAVPVPVPSPGDALVRVDACGVNHVDLDMRAGVSRFPLKLPHTLGRESAGRVIEVGDGVDPTWVGRRVVVSTYISCGMCRWCASAQPALCDSRQLPGLDLPGGYAEFIRVPARALLDLPDTLSATEAAALPVAFGTAWSALIRKGVLQAGETLLVLGASGGVGTAAIQVSRLAGAAVIAVVGSATKLASVLRLGATAAVDDSDDPMTDAVERTTSGRGVDVVLDLVGGDHFRKGLGCLAKNGRYLVVGAHAGEVQPLDLVELFRKSQRIIGAGGANMSDLSTVLRLAADGQLRPVIHAVIPLDQAANAHRIIAARQHVGKIVLSTEASS